MLTVMPGLNNQAGQPLYRQLFAFIRDEILAGAIPAGEKLPSLRQLAQQLGLSLTTVRQAYDQLAVEGYVQNRPRSGFFVNVITIERAVRDSADLAPAADILNRSIDDAGLEGQQVGGLLFDPANFNFIKWRKCYQQVMTDHIAALLQEGRPEGEPALRKQIARYIYQARGVRCDWRQIVISAGTQQLINLLCLILRRLDISLVSFEDPGYLPVRSIFRDRGFRSQLIAIDREGIVVERLPANLQSTVYVSPSNQFPTGSIMPVGRRYALLEWARTNRSLIIEDDYNSELRYDSRPVPSLAGLDEEGSVVYIGAFSSTLYPSAKISYMVLPTTLSQTFQEFSAAYDQSCSKAEQLTLGLFMEQGYYQSHLRRIRKLYAQKRQIISELIERHCGKTFRILNNSSGLHMLLELRQARHKKAALALCQAAAKVGLTFSPVMIRPDDDQPSAVLFYFTRIPLNQIDSLAGRLSYLTDK
ncbi:MAG TPA: PLP-dependent aminotransferase family protein [Clostridiales bacterium]|nr:PLP-dependent aminotransferase family protein [Clostridiales bacterium]